MNLLGADCVYDPSGTLDIAKFDEFNGPKTQSTKLLLDE